MDFTRAECVARMLCTSPTVIKSGYITCETFSTSPSSSTRSDGAGNGSDRAKFGLSSWSTSYFVLCGTDRDNARLFRFLSPNDGKPKEHLKLADLSIKLHSGAILMYEENRSHWLLCCSDENETLAWSKALQELQRAVPESGGKANRESKIQGFDGVDEDHVEEFEDLDYRSRTLPLFLGSTTPAKKNRDDLKVLIGSTSNLRNLMTSGGLWNSSLRSLCWRKVLGLFPSNPEHWIAAVSERRNEYEKIRNRHLKPRPESTGLEMDEYLNDKLMESEIWKDLERTNITEYNVSVHGAETVKQLMLRVLFIWSKENPELGYKQGMNEILAVVMMVVYGERTEYFEHDESVNDDDLRMAEVLTDARFVEHDCYELLGSLMIRLRPIYSPRQDDDDDAGFTKRPVSLVKRLEHIQHVLLQRTDPELAAILHHLGLEPHMFLIRWIRVMCAREVGMPQLLLLWDAIFGQTPEDFSLVDSICVALLTFSEFRPVLIRAMDCSMALEMIKRFPSLQEHHVLKVVYKAKKIHESHEESLHFIKVQLEHQRQSDRAGEPSESANPDERERTPSFMVDSNSFESRFQREFFNV